MNRVDAWHEEYQADVDYRLSVTLLQTLEQLAAAMARQGVSHAELARRMGVNKAVISRVMNGPDNVTLKTLVRMAHHLNLQVLVMLSPAPRPAADGVRERPAVASLASRRPSSGSR